jgi:hypothetical protein
MEVGKYFITIRIFTDELEIERKLGVSVIKNPDIDFIEKKEKEIPELKSKIEDYAKYVDVSDLETKMYKIEKAIEKVKTAIKEDNIAVVERYRIEIKKEIDNINSKLEALKFRKFLSKNKWYIISAIVISLWAPYLGSEIVYPYYKTGKEIKKLVDEEKALIKARVETEKQYFLRKIDEKTFFKIMIDKQGKILKIRGMINQKKEERTKLLLSKLNPIIIAKWFEKRIEEIPKTIKIIPKAISKRIKRKPKEKRKK